MRKSVWAGGLFLCLGLGLAGCANMDLAGLMAVQMQPGGEKVVEGSVAAVAESTHRGLQQAGFMDAKLTQKGEEFHINGQISTGSKFDLVLTREKNGETANAKERTHIKLLWEGAKEDRVGGMLLAQVEMLATK